MVVSNIFYFHPYLGKIPILTHIFQMGWFNHQLENTMFCIFFIPKAFDSRWASRSLLFFSLQVASGGRYDLRVVQSGAKASRINVAVALDGEKALGSSVLS